jgi:Flp pilus assembly protein TadG
MTRNLKFRHDERGAVSVEFTITFLVMMMVVLMMMELCSAIYTYVVLSDAVNEGVRYAIVNSTDQSGTEAKVKTYASYSLHDVSAMSVSVTYPDGQNAPGRVAISLSYPYLPYINFLANPPTMHAYAEGRLVY